MFYMIYREGHDPPIIKHDTLEKAGTEAARLAGMYPKEKIYILQSIISYTGRTSWKREVLT